MHRPYLKIYPAGIIPVHFSDRKHEILDSFCSRGEDKNVEESLRKVDAGKTKLPKEIELSDPIKPSI